MKELRNTELFGDGKLLGYRTDDGIMNFTVHYKNNKPAYIEIKTQGSGNHAILSLERLDEALTILLTMRKDLHRGRV